jgi:hypothetical protein
MGAVNIIANATTIGQIPASGSEVSFSQILYKYANLTLPYNPNDPGLSYTYNNASLAQSVPLLARFFNLLNEPSLPVQFNVGTSTITISASGVGPSGGQIFECLDVRLFGAKGDGVTDDTDAIQAALDRAHENYIAISLLSASSSGGIVVASGGIIGPTTVCIPSGLVCLVSPRYFDTANVTNGAVPGTNPPGWSGRVQDLHPFNDGYVCLSMDDGVTLLIDGQILFFNNVAAMTTAVNTYPYSQLQIFIIGNKNAWNGGPWYIFSADPTPTYDGWLLTGESGPRNTDIHITGSGSIDCNGLPYWNQVTPVLLGAPFANDQVVMVGALRWNKCDNSSITGITILNQVLNGVSNGLEVGNSLHLTIDGITIQNVLCDDHIFYPGAAILLDLVRDSIVQNCTIIDFGCVGIELCACIRMQILSNTLTRGLFGVSSDSGPSGPIGQGSDGGGLDMIAVLDAAYENIIFFFDAVNFNSLISDNKIIQNRGASWRPNTWYNVGDVVSPSRGLISDYTQQTIGDDIFHDGHWSGGTEPIWADSLGSGTDDSGGYLVWEAVASEQNLDVVDFVNVGGLRTTYCNGIKLYGALGNLPMVGATITNNVVSDNLGYGIVWFGLDSALIAHNQVTRNQYGGLYEIPDSTCVNCSIVKNTVTNNGAVVFSPPLNDINLDSGATGQTVDNAQSAPTAIMRGGISQNFYNVASGEVPAGTVNGTNKTFTLAHPPQTGYLDLYINPAGTDIGLYLLDDPTQYTITGSTITFVTAPPSGSTLLANYQW